MYLAKIGMIRITKKGIITKIYDRRTKFQKTEKTILYKDKKGYVYSSITFDYKRYMAKVHRIVWTYFNGKIPDGLTINHKDGNKENNDLENLELATMKYQVYHSMNIIKTRNDMRKEHNVNAKINRETVKKIRHLRMNGKKLREIKELLNLDIDISVICKITNNKIWK